jgi:hypothetical protein
MAGGALRARPRERLRSVAVTIVLAMLAVSCTGSDGGAGLDSTGASPETSSARPSSTTSTTSTTSVVDATSVVDSTVADSTSVGTTSTASAPPATVPPSNSPATVPPTTSAPGSPIVQPPQPVSGPGGSDYEHGDWRVGSGGEGPDAWFVFEPVDPAPATAPLAIVMHGYFEFAGFDQMYEFIRHTVRHGTIVVYPRWQTDTAVPCPGPFDIEPCMAAARNGIAGALEYLAADATRVQPELDGASYFGFSFGGIITTNLVNRWQTLGLPEPQVVFLEDPHDGGLYGTGEPALDDDLGGIPASTLFQCHSGADGIIAARPDSSCNAIVPGLGHLADANKDLVMTRADTHGTPALSSVHGVCAAPPGTADAYDWNFCWKVWDALRSTAAAGDSAQFALGDTPEHRSNGLWSDGTPVAPLTIQDAAPIGP